MTITTKHENLEDCIRTRKKLRTEVDTANEKVLNLETELAALGKGKKTSEFIADIEALNAEGIKLIAENEQLKKQLSEAADPGILEGCKIRVRELVRERTKLQEEFDASNGELTKDLYRLNEENKDHLKTIADLQAEIKVFEESYNHVHNQLKQLVVEVEKLSK